MNCRKKVARCWTFPTSPRGVGSQALPIPTGEYEEFSGESGRLLDGGARQEFTIGSSSIYRGELSFL